MPSQSAVVTQARRAALDILRAMRSGELLDPAFSRMVEQVPARDRGWLQELVYGTVRLRGRLDFILGQFVRRNLTELDPDVLDILRLGAYQLIEMHSVPAYAAVSQSVELARANGFNHVSGLVNGVLQSLRRAQDTLQRPDETDALRFLSTWGSHPPWLVQRWLAQFGRAATEALIEADNTRPEVFLRVIGIAVDAAMQRLHDAELSAQPVADVPDAVKIDASDVVRALELVPAVVQDPAAMLVARYAAFGKGVVADLCAAPGGKALAITGGDAQPDYVIAGDVSAQRLGKVRENAERVGTSNVGFVVSDARRAPLRSIEQALIDVPCTGTGTLRRHPDGKWRLAPADIESLVRLQEQILEEVASLMRPGGLLVYATCSLEPEENEQQVAKFLDRHAEFELECGDAVDARFVRAGQLRVLPHEHGFDGGYAARLRRAA